MSGSEKGRYTMKFSASQAAKKTGKSVPTITRAIKSGKLSAEKTDSGGYQIDASELFRVFNSVTEESNASLTSLQPETPDVTHNETLNARHLKERIEALEEALSDAKAERDEWRNQAKRLALALPAPDAAAPSKRSLWARLTGR